MTDYANEDVDSLRAVAQYCGGTEHGVFLAGLADRMEQVIVEAQPVFTEEDLRLIRHVPYAPYEEADRGEEYGRLQCIADRIERILPVEAAVDVA